MTSAAWVGAIMPQVMITSPIGKSWLLIGVSGGCTIEEGRNCSRSIRRQPITSIATARTQRKQFRSETREARSVRHERQDGLRKQALPSREGPVTFREM